MLLDDGSNSQFNHERNTNTNIFLGARAAPILTARKALTVGGKRGSRSDISKRSLRPPPEMKFHLSLAPRSAYKIFALQLCQKISIIS
jgi:hypothetical protein